MTRDDIFEMIHQLEEAEAQKQLLTSDKRRIIASAVPPDVVKTLESIDAEFDMRARSLDANIADLKDQIKQAVLQTCETMHGQHIAAVWYKGRAHYDTRALDRFLDKHTDIRAQIRQFRREGEPSVAIRWID